MTTSRMTTNGGVQEEGFFGLGRRDRQRLKRRWKASGSGLSLKQWASANDMVGDAAQAWLNAKKSL
jgi:hypothetical protein